MRKSFVLLCLVVLIPILTVTIFTPKVVHAEMGFWRLNEIPKDQSVLEVASRATFRVTVLSGSKISIDLDQFPSIDSAVKNSFSVASSTPAATLLRKRALNRCLEKKNKACVIFASTEEGAVFLTDDHSTIWGALHVFRDIIDEKQDEPIDLVLENKDNQVVFGDSSGSHAKITLVYAEALPKLSPEKQKEFMAVDFIRLRLSRPLNGIQPLVMKKELSGSTGDTAYSLGFPGYTSDRINYQQSDSDGISQYVTFGKTISIQEHMIRTKKDPTKVPPETLKGVNGIMVVVDSDCYSGMSGGPIIDTTGEVIGILTGGYPIDGSASEPRMTLGLRSQWLIQASSALAPEQ